MKGRNNGLASIVAAFGLALLILDSKTALSGTTEGIELCLQTVIPSLFPFILLSLLLTSYLSGIQLTLLRPLGKLCGIPEGTETLLLVGLIGGYPVGAQCVSYAYRSQQLEAEDAKRMLAFCNNCGPAFLFGMAATVFDENWIPWSLWGIHIVSAIAVGTVFSCGRKCRAHRAPPHPITLVQGLNRALHVMAGICGWVIIFRVIIAFFKRWFLWILPTELQVAVCGLLELTNGCIALSGISSSGLRFILCAALLGFGGVCVTMQSYSVTEGLDRRLYLPGKLLQSCISLFLAYLIQGVVFKDNQRVEISLWLPALALLICLVVTLAVRKKENSSRIPQSVGV